MCKEFISWNVGIRNREEEKHPIIGRAQWILLSGIEQTKFKNNKVPCLRG
jgi:hypothetical protein